MSPGRSGAERATYLDHVDACHGDTKTQAVASTVGDETVAVAIVVWCDYCGARRTLPV